MDREAQRGLRKSQHLEKEPIMMRVIRTVAVSAVVLATGACTIVDETEIAVKKSFGGDVKEEPIRQGIQPYVAPWNWGASFTKYPLREVQFPAEGRAEVIEILTSDQLKVAIEGALRYRIEPASAVELYKTVGGPGDVHSYVYNAYRSAARDAVAGFTAAELLSQGRDAVGERIRELVGRRIVDKGLILTDYFVRDIDPPEKIRMAIEEKLAAEQEIERERHRIQIEAAKADQRRAEAEGIRDAQTIIAESLSPSYLAYERIKALQAAAEGENNTIIDVNGNVSPIVGGLR
jgi:regulator of protease activity HflC (stomatin/prohibitin superfamily)